MWGEIVIIYKNKQFIKMGLYPNTDWLGNADWVLDDNDPKEAGLEELIMAFYPNFDIITDVNGKISDIVATDPVVKEVIPEPPTNEELAAALVELAEVISNG